MSNLLEVKNLTVGFKVRDSIFTAVEDASFEINKNETMALVENQDQESQSQLCQYCNFCLRVKQFLVRTHLLNLIILKYWKCLTNNFNQFAVRKYL